MNVISNQTISYCGLATMNIITDITTLVSETKDDFNESFMRPQFSSENIVI